MMKSWMAAVCLPLFAVAALIACMDRGEARTVEPPVLLEGEASLQQEHRLSLKKGAYLIGRLEVTQGDAALWLLDADGGQPRLLVDTAQGESRFHLRVSVDSPRVVLRPAAAAVSYRLLREAYWPESDAQPEVEQGAYLSRRIAALAEEVERGSADSAWSALIAGGTPLMEPLENGDYVLSFVYRGAERNVRVLGAPSGDHDELLRLGASDIWYRSYRVPADTRLSYKLAPDVPVFEGTPRQRRVAILATARSDPHNRQPWPEQAEDHWRQFSTVALPGAPVQPGLEGKVTAGGTLQTLRFTSLLLGNQRDVYLFRPEGFRPENPDNLLLVLFDARDYLRRVNTPAILGRLMAAGSLPSVAIVLIDNPSPAHRARELPGDPRFARFIAEELLPWSQQQLGTDIPAERRVIAGSSYGGLAATRIALAYPQVFGNVLSMSASHWWLPPEASPDQPVYLASAVIAQPRKPLRFFMSAGTFERSHAGVAGIIDSNRHFRDVLLARGYEVHYREYAGGHDYLIWQGALGDGLLALFPGGGAQLSP